MATLNDRDDRGDVFDVIRNRLVRILPKSESNVIDKFVVTNYGLSGHYLPHKEHIDQNHLIKTEGRQAMIIFQVKNIYYRHYIKYIRKYEYVTDCPSRMLRAQ